MRLRHGLCPLIRWGAHGAPQPHQLDFWERREKSGEGKKREIKAEGEESKGKEKGGGWCDLGEGCFLELAKGKWAQNEVNEGGNYLIPIDRHQNMIILRLPKSRLNFKLWFDGKGGCLHIQHVRPRAGAPPTGERMSDSRAIFSGLLWRVASVGKLQFFCPKIFNPRHRFL